jgi:hypothetical protein
MNAPQQQLAAPDNLGAFDGNNIQRYDPRELATTIGGYREAWSDLGKLVQDIDAVGMVADTSAHPWAPMVQAQIRGLLEHGQHRHHHHPTSMAVHRLLQHLHGVLARQVDLEREKRLWHAKSNVVQSVNWIGVAANTASSTATVRAPYSGVNYMVLDCLMPANLTPLGYWTNISFASINFAQAGGTISYSTPGASGTPTGAVTGGMGFTCFYEDKTAPEGCRGWNPWTGWILSSDAVSTWQWFNPDLSNSRSLICDILMRSSPCDTANWQSTGQYGAGQASIPWAGFHYASNPHIGSHALNMMYAAVLGLSGVNKGHPSEWFSGQHMGHAGNFGSVGPGFGAQPTGHGGPWGPALHAGHHPG